MTALPATARIDGQQLSILFAVGPSDVPEIAYLGPRIADDVDIAAVFAATRHGPHEGQPNIPVAGGLLPQNGAGFLGSPAISMRCDDFAIVPAFTLNNIASASDKIVFRFEDSFNKLCLSIAWRIGAGEVVRTTATLTNSGKRSIAVDWLASLTLPLPGWATILTRFTGRWSGEMREEKICIPRGSIVDQSRGGKPGFGGGNWLIAGEADATANCGRMIAAHLAWSGDYRSLIERDSDGTTQLQLGCRLDAGEVMLSDSENFTTPEAVFAFSFDGRNGLRRAFHAHVRQDVLPARADWGPRKVHVNSWDALGFSLDETALIALANNSAALGIERFVLDDGWFAGRRNDRTSLGDWTPDTERFPNGLAPIIDRVTVLGMDFGLWVEPEMISVDSDLYRHHPDWCLHLEGRARPEQRQQLVLDLTRKSVTDHLFDALDKLLRSHAIAYLKWDHNRDLFPLANDAGPVGYRQTLAVYALLDRLRAAHPTVEIEACSSGGGRIDYAMLTRCHRVWPSDNNDPVERLAINATWGLFLPPEIIGTHIGPQFSLQTSRFAPMDFRAKVALFGHMGIEANPARMSDDDRDILKALIAIYKDWRAVLHSGHWEEITFADPAVTGTLARGTDRSLALVARTGFGADFDALPVRLPGFDPDVLYRVRLLDPWPRKAQRYLHDSDNWRAGRILPGRALAESGLAIPLTHPDTAWLIAVERI